jgi:hypothetical protein
MNRSTQRNQILALLRETHDWVPLPSILALGVAHYSARIHEIRHSLGLRVENRTEHRGGKVLSWFRLVEGPAPTPAPPPSAEPVTDAPPLFPDARPSRWTDPEEVGR